MSKSLVSAFNIKNNNLIRLGDYEIFQDKEALDKLRSEITFSIIDDYNNDNNYDIHGKVDYYTRNLNLSTLEKQYLYNLLDNEILGMGPLTEVMRDTSVSKVFVNGPDKVYVLGSDGYLEDKSISFINDDHILRTVKNIASKNDLNLNFDEAYLSFKTKDNTKFILLNTPLVSSPSLTIIKSNKTLESPDELVRLGTITPYMARFLEASVKLKLNILVCGKKNSGKKTFINALMEFIPKNERTLYIGYNGTNDKNVLSVNTSDIDILKYLGANYMVYSKDDVLSLLKLVNTRDGIISSLDTRDFSLDNIVTNVSLENNNLGKDIILNSIYGGFDMVIYLERQENARIKVTSIREVDNNSLREVFSYQDGTFNFNPKSNTIYKRVKASGDNSLDDIFGES